MISKKAVPQMSDRDPSQLLTVAYVSALAIIALLTLISHGFSSHITQKQKESGEILKALGKQRSYVQQISYYSTNYYEQGQQIDYDLLVQALDGLKKSHKFVMDTVGKADPAPSSSDTTLAGKSALYRVYYAAPFYLDSEIGAFMAQTEKFLKFDKSDISTERQKSRDYISSRFTKYFVPSLDAALENYQEETLKKISKYHKMQLLSVYAILVVLLLEAIFIFNPLVRHIRLYHRMLHAIAMTDPLTELRNRRAFETDAEPALSAARKKGAPSIIALTDLDKFKSVNDTHGHDTGDKVLQHFANILRKGSREGDITGRMGGEEFAIILPGTARTEGEKVLERIRAKLEATPCAYIDADGKPAQILVTVSMGFVEIMPDGKETLENLLKKADEGLYTAKEQGRNRIVFVPLSE